MKEKQYGVLKEVERFDVIVAGGGPAGIGAALAAALNGAKTLMLEGRSFFGGVAATSLWMPMNRLMINGKSRGGVHEMLVRKLESYGKLACREGKVTWTDGDGLHIHPDYLKRAVFELLEENGCKYRLYSPVVGAVVEDQVLKKAVVFSKEGNIEYEAKVFIDCTGDGDLSAYAGAITSVGREEDGALMPVTLGFSMANVDTVKLFQWYNSENYGPEIKKILEQAEKDGFKVSNWYSFDNTTVPGIVSVNNGGLKDIGRIDVLNPYDATLAERTGIDIAIDFVEIAKRFKLPGLENCYLDRTGAAVGVRETRRVICDYVLTMEDAMEGTEFEDVIARRYGAVDLAGLKEDEDYSMKMKSGYGYPYRALLPKGLNGLLVAGRCGSYTHLALAAGKSMGNMMAIGQAAGVAGAIASRKNITPREVNAAEIQEILQKSGVEL